MNDWVQALKDYKKMSELGFIDLGRKMARILSKEVKEMTKKEFENALDRSIEAMLDGGQPGNEIKEEEVECVNV